MLKLHRSLRDCVDIMGVGVGLPRADHVAEEGVVSAAPASAGTKDVGDVRRVVPMLLGIVAIVSSLLLLDRPLTRLPEALSVTGMLRSCSSLKRVPMLRLRQRCFATT